MFLKNKKGIVLILSLTTIMVLLIFGSIFIFRTITEKNFADRERLLEQAFYLADGGCQEGLNQIDTFINTDLMTTVNDTNPQVVAADAQSYVTSSDGLGFLIEYAKNTGTSQFTLDGNEAIYESSSMNLGNGTYQYQIKVWEKGNPILVNVDTWDFPYFYRIETTGLISGVKRTISLLGDFTVRVQRDNFAKFALFTDIHTLKPEDGGNNVWFTDKTNFAGPLHTNQRYNFAFNPGAIFDGAVTQHYDTARFYNLGSPVLRNDDHNSDRDVPTFNAGFTRSADEITLASSVQKEDLIDQATGSQNFSGNGIFIANNGTALTGGIFIRGNASISMSVDGGNHAVYAITEGATTKIITVDKDNDQTTILTVGSGTETFSGIPDGLDDLGTIMHVEGSVTSLGGTVQNGTELTISTENDLIITDHILYSNYTPAVGNPGDAGYVPPNAQGATNLLGLISWDDDVRIATTAPDDINVHGIIMARDGVLQVDDYDDTGVGSRGVATLLGGVITEYYGGFGLFNGNTGQQIAGYGRNFVYDSRTLLGKSPPYYPSMQTFVAFTNDITDKLAWKEGSF
ncbi:MAG: DUF4900 domain-containing protein [Candidatus Omnitrophota bacterium]